MPIAKFSRPYEAKQTIYERLNDQLDELRLGVDPESDVAVYHVVELLIHMLDDWSAHDGGSTKRALGREITRDLLELASYRGVDKDGCLSQLFDPEDGDFYAYGLREALLGIRARFAIDVEYESKTDGGD